MSYKKFITVAAVLGAITFSGCRSGFLSGGDVPAPAQPQAPSGPVSVDGVRTSYADVVQKTSPAVVRIEAEHKAAAQTQQFPFGDDDFFRQMPVPQRPQGRAPVERGLGSGVIVSADGTILTNYHVVEGAERITIETTDNKSFEAKVVGSDQPSDLAVLKIEAQNLPYLTLGNSDNVRVGDIVLAIGNPLGIGQTVTAGIISAKGRRSGLSYGSYEDFLQTDAPINRGNSGGALVNLNGFSIPSNMAKSGMEQLLQNGKVRRGMLGINIQNITSDTAKALELSDTTGVLVSNVRGGSAADKAGIKRGDIITAINGEKIEDSNVLRNKVASTTPGTSINLTVLRDGKEQQLTATLDEFNVEEAKRDNANPSDNRNAPQGRQNGKLGLSLQPITPEISRQLELPDNSGGLVVTDVDPNGAAAAEGIARGDVILEINRQQVNSVDDVQSALDRSGDRPILLLINRRGQTIYMTVRPG